MAPRHHSYALPGPGIRPGGKVDLHRNLPNLLTSDEEVWATFDAVATTMPVGGADVRVLDRTGLALHVVLHAVQHGFGAHTDEDLRRAIALLPLDEWRAVAGLAGRLGIAGVVGFGLRRHPAGADLADRLGLPLPQTERADSAYCFEDPSAPRGAASVARLRSAPTLREKATIVRWAVAPSPAKIRFEAGGDLVGTRSLALGYVRRWRRLARSIRPAVGHVVRTRGDAPRP